MLQIENGVYSVVRNPVAGPFELAALARQDSLFRPCELEVEFVRGPREQEVKHHLSDSSKSGYQGDAAFLAGGLLRFCLGLSDVGWFAVKVPTYHI